MVYKVRDLTGERFGKLTVISRNISPASLAKKRAMWDCICVCGRSKIVDTNKLKLGRVKSCGCGLFRSNTSRFGSREVHGMSKTALYRTWNNMLNRCLREKDARYDDYGGRGITVCEDWLSFSNFYRDMGYPPGPRYSIDRVDNDLGYSKANCKWSSRKEQARNKRSSRVLEIDGVAKNLVDWSSESGICHATILYRIKKGYAPKDAVFMPLRTKRKYSPQSSWSS